MQSLLMLLLHALLQRSKVMYVICIHVATDRIANCCRSGCKCTHCLYMESGCALLREVNVSKQLTKAFYDHPQG